MTDVFISYSRCNLGFVHKLDTALTVCGKVSWFDQKKEPLEGLPPSSKWWDEIKYGIETADNFLVIISHESIVSPYCNAEIAYALQQEKRIVTVLYCETESETGTLQAVDAAIDAIPDGSDLPPVVSATITDLRSLTRRNWLEISRVQYVTFSNGDMFERSLEILIKGLDMDLAWIRTWSQVRQAARIWAETRDDSYRWSETRLKPVREAIRKRGQLLTEVETAFVRPEFEYLIEEVNNPTTHHFRRAAIGDRLRDIGDTRPGVGLRDDGLPNIEWCNVPSGKVALKDLEDVFPVEAFDIAKYPITYAQYRAFLEAADGYCKTEWWEDLALRQEEPTLLGRANHPVERISWYDAVAFCRWLSTKLDASMRLPTEWEWQLAATGGNLNYEYPWGSDWDGNRCNTSESGLSRATAVGMYPSGASSVGALDISGNVWEWCLNEYNNPANTGLSGSEQRGIRGGSWSNERKLAQVIGRGKLGPEFRYYGRGFRVVCALPPFIDNH